MLWYFSHPTSDTDTLFDQAVRDHFAVLHLENPNVMLHRHGYTLMGAEYMFIPIAMLASYDGCVAIDLPNGRWSAAVGKEVNWFAQNHRPVFRLQYEHTADDQWSFVLATMSAIDSADICSVEQTRALVRYYQHRPLGGRSQNDRLTGRHNPTREQIAKCN